MEKNKIYRLTAYYMILWLFVGMQAMSCKATVSQNTSERTLPAFNQLNLCISADVILTQGTIQKVDIQASDRLLKLIETEVKDGKLTIKWTERFVSHTEKIKIYITMVEINALKISGSGDISASEAVTTNNIDLSISGSGNIKLDKLKAENIHSSISGSADISISGPGTADKLDVSISGSGNIKAQGMPVKNADVSLSGSGNCSVNALETLKARVSGSGDIYYSGSATIDAKVSGSGAIKHLN